MEATLVKRIQRCNNYHQNISYASHWCYGPCVSSFCTQNLRKQGWDAFRRTMVIEGLGIVNEIELSFSDHCLLIWPFSGYLEIRFAKTTTNQRQGVGKNSYQEKVWSIQERENLQQELEDALNLESVYNSEMIDAGFVDADWEFE